MATENKWGYLRIQGALLNLGHVVARTTIAKSSQWVRRNSRQVVLRMGAGSMLCD